MHFVQKKKKKNSVGILNIVKTRTGSKRVIVDTDEIESALEEFFFLLWSK